MEIDILKIRVLTNLLLATFAGGCCSQTPEQPVAEKPAAAIEHFIPGPPLPILKAPTADEMFGQAAGTGVNAPIAQSFTATEAGYISEIDLGTQRQGGFREGAAPTAPLLVEIRTLQDGLPGSAEDSIKFRGTIAYSILPPAGASEGGMLRLDLRRAGIHVDKGANLAIVQTPGDGAQLQIESVMGKPYGGGALYRLQNDQWQDENTEAQFRVYATPDLRTGNLGSATNATGTEPQNIPLIVGTRPAAGILIARCIPRPRVVTPSIVPPEAGTWQFRAHVFKYLGDYYVELTTFNGTNRRGFPYAPMASAPRAITLSRLGETTGRVIFPQKPTGVYDFQQMQQQISPGPGEGTVRQYNITDQSGPLAPGTYVLSVVIGQLAPDQVINLTFNVP